MTSARPKPTDTGRLPDAPDFSALVDSNSAAASANQPAAGDPPPASQQPQTAQNTQNTSQNTSGPATNAAASDQNQSGGATAPPAQTDPGQPVSGQQPATDATALKNGKTATATTDPAGKTTSGKKTGQGGTDAAIVPIVTPQQAAPVAVVITATAAPAAPAAPATADGTSSTTPTGPFAGAVALAANGPATPQAGTVQNPNADTPATTGTATAGAAAPPGAQAVVAPPSAGDVLMQVAAAAQAPAPAPGAAADAGKKPVVKAVPTQILSTAGTTAKAGPSPAALAATAPQTTDPSAKSAAAQAQPGDATPKTDQAGDGTAKTDVAAKDAPAPAPVAPLAHQLQATLGPPTLAPEAGRQAAAGVQSLQSIQPQSPATAAVPVTQLNVALATAAAVPLSGLAVEISAQAQIGRSRFEIRLDPPELGRIDVRLDVDSQGQVTSHLTVAKPETLDLLRRDAPQLQQALQDAGLKTSDNGLQFSLRDQSSSWSGRDDGSQNRNAQRLIISEEDTVPAEVAGRSYGRMLASSGGVDIRV